MEQANKSLSLSRRLPQDGFGGDKNRQKKEILSHDLDRSLDPYFCYVLYSTLVEHRRGHIIGQLVCVRALLFPPIYMIYS